MAEINKTFESSKLKTYTLYAFLASLGVSIGFAIWFYIRFRNAGGNDEDTDTLTSIVHMLAYLAFAVVSCIGLFGWCTHQTQYLLWFIYGCLAISGAELICILVSLIFIADSKKYGVVVIILKVVAIIVFMISAVFAFLWKRAIANKGSDVTISAGVSDAKDNKDVEAKAADPKAHEVKAHEAKAHEVKAHEVKAHEVKAHEAKAHEVKAHEVKAHEVKADKKA